MKLPQCHKGVINQSPVHKQLNINDCAPRSFQPESSSNLRCNRMEKMSLEDVL